MLTYILLASVTYEGNRILLLFKSNNKKKNTKLRKRLVVDSYSLVTIYQDCSVYKILLTENYNLKIYKHYMSSLIFIHYYFKFKF